MGLIFKIKKDLVPGRNVNTTSVPYKETNSDWAGSEYFFDIYQDMFKHEQEELERKYLALQKSKNYLIKRIYSFKYNIINFYLIQDFIEDVTSLKDINNIDLKFFTIKTNKENLKDNFHFFVCKLIKVNNQINTLNIELLEKGAYTVNSKIKFANILRCTNQVIAQDIKNGKKLATGKIGSFFLIKKFSEKAVNWFRTSQFKKELEELGVTLAEYRKIGDNSFEIVNEGQNYILTNYNSIKVKSKWSKGFIKGLHLRFYNFKFNQAILREVYNDNNLMNKIIVQKPYNHGV